MLPLAVAVLLQVAAGSLPARPARAEAAPSGSLADVAARSRAGTPGRTPPAVMTMGWVAVVGSPGHAASITDLSVEVRLREVQSGSSVPRFRQRVTGTIRNRGLDPACSPRIDVTVFNRTGERVGNGDGTPVPVIRPHDSVPFEFIVPIEDPSRVGTPATAFTRIVTTEPYQEYACGRFRLTEAEASLPVPAPAVGVLGNERTSPPVQTPVRLGQTQRPGARVDFSDIPAGPGSTRGTPGRKAPLEALSVELRTHNIQQVTFNGFGQWVVGTIRNDSSEPACSPRLAIEVYGRRGNVLATVEEEPVQVVPPHRTIEFEARVTIEDPRLHGVPRTAAAHVVRVEPYTESCGTPAGSHRKPIVLGTPVPDEPIVFDDHGRTAPIRMPDGSPIPDRLR